MKNLISYIAARLMEPSSWLAVVAFAGAVAIQLNSHQSLLIALGAGVMAVALPEK